MDSRTVDVEKEQLPTQADEFNQNTQVVFVERWPYGTKEPAALFMSLALLGMFLLVSSILTTFIFWFPDFCMEVRFFTIVADILTFLCWVVLTFQFYHKFMSEIKMGLLLVLFSTLICSPVFIPLFFLKWYFTMFISMLFYSLFLVSVVN